MSVTRNESKSETLTRSNPFFWQLSVIDSFAKSGFTYEPKLEVYGGGYRTIICGYLGNNNQYKFTNEDKQDDTLAVVYSSFRFNENQVNEDNVIAAKHSVELLINKKVPPQFVQFPLVFTETGEYVSLRAFRNLEHFEIETINFNDVKKLIAQILLAINELHLKNLVHLDIKDSNFLIFKFGTQLVAKISDLDTLIEVDNNGFAINPAKIVFGTINANYRNLAPEIPPYEFLGNIKKNLIANDCYATGILIKKLITRFFHKNNSYTAEEVKESNQLFIYANKLTLALTKYRKDIAYMLSCRIFGATPAEREKYFNAIRAEADYHLQINNVPFDYHKELFTFLPLLNTEIKKIYFEIKQVGEEIEECQLSLKNKSATFRQLYQKVESDFLQLSYHIQNINKDTTQEAFKNILTETEKTGIKQLAKLFNKGFKKKNKESVNSQEYKKVLCDQLMNIIETTVTAYEKTTFTKLGFFTKPEFINEAWNLRISTQKALNANVDLSEIIHPIYDFITNKENPMQKEFKQNIKLHLKMSLKDCKKLFEPKEKEACLIM